MASKRAGNMSSKRARLEIALSNIRDTLREEGEETGYHDLDRHIQWMQTRAEKIKALLSSDLRTVTEANVAALV